MLPPGTSSVEDLRFTADLLVKPPPRGLAVETTLEHFAIVTYWVDPAALARHLHPRFEPVALAADGVQARALVSVVTFLDRDFRFVAFPWWTGRFGQTNYRAYVRDTETGEHVVWFFGTCLDSLSVVVPHYAWRLPWHRARIAFDCRYDRAASRYAHFAVTTESSWSPARLVLEDSGSPVARLAGVGNLEAALVFLTHPLRGYFFRRDGALGSYRIWHERANLTTGRAIAAEYPLLDRLGLVAIADLQSVHSVLLQPAIDFTIYLPPRRVP